MKWETYFSHPRSVAAPPVIPIGPRDTIVYRDFPTHEWQFSVPQMNVGWKKMPLQIRANLHSATALLLLLLVFCTTLRIKSATSKAQFLHGTFYNPRTWSLGGRTTLDVLFLFSKSDKYLGLSSFLLILRPLGEFQGDHLALNKYTNSHTSSPWVVTLLLSDLPTTILRYRFVLTFPFFHFSPFNSIAGEKDYRDVGLQEQVQLATVAHPIVLKKLHKT